MSDVVNDVRTEVVRGVTALLTGTGKLPPAAAVLLKPVLDRVIDELVPPEKVERLQKIIARAIDAKDAAVAFVDALND